jgi:hypothetical protein
MNPQSSFLFCQATAEFEIGHQGGLLHSSEIDFGESALGQKLPRPSLQLVSASPPKGPAAATGAAAKADSGHSVGLPTDRETCRRPPYWGVLSFVMVHYA